MNSDVLIGHGAIDYIIVILLSLYAFGAGQTKPHRILYILPACISFFFFIEVGPRLTPEKLVPFIFVSSVILSKGVNYFAISTKKNKIENTWISMIWIVVGVSIIIGFIYNNYYSNYLTTSFLSTRLIVQITSYINFILIYVIVRKECTKPFAKNIFFKSLLFTSLILCIYGVYQYIAHEFGLPYRGIVYSENSTGIGSFTSDESTIFRINSLANEPKRLTYVICLSILLLLLKRNLIIEKIKSVPYYFILLLHIYILWLTYSTSIYFSIAFFLAFLILYVVFIKFNKMLFRQLLLIVILSFTGYYYQKNYFDKLYETRVQNQLEREEVRAEVKGQEFLFDNPEMFILGLGPGIYNFALAKEYPNKAGLSENGRFLIPFNSALMTYIYDFGVIGFFIFLIPLFKIINNKKYSLTNDYSIFVVFLYCTAITLNPTSSLFLFLGAFDGLNNQLN